MLASGSNSDIDLSSTWVAELIELQGFEKKILFTEFEKHKEEANIDVEYRILTRITNTNKHLEKMAEYNDTMYKKNRYDHLIAFKHSMPKCIDRNNNTNIYINANYIESPIFKESPKRYIITQAPTSKTNEDFWHMIYEHDICSIVMLCSFKEDTFSLEDKYYPKSYKKAVFGDYEIRNLGSVKDDFVSFRKLNVKYTPEKTTKSLKHYHLNCWPDMQVIKENDFERFLDFVKLVSATIENSVENNINQKQPVLIHCKAGNGRSGTFLAILCIYDYISVLYKEYGDFYRNKEIIETNKLGISIFAIVRRMREDRWGLIETPKQYYFVYSFTLYMLRNLSKL